MTNGVAVLSDNYNKKFRLHFVLTFVGAYVYS